VNFDYIFRVRLNVKDPGIEECHIQVMEIAWQCA
jgi:hypothetical protein